MSAIESVLQERRIFPPSAKAMAGAAISGMDAYKALTSEAERDYNEGRSTQIPLNPVVRIKGRFSRRLRDGKQELVLAR